MTTRNIKQFEASVNKLADSQIKHTDVETIMENNKPEVVSTDHEKVLELAATLRRLAAKLIADEKQFANDEILQKMMKDKDLMAEYAARLTAGSDAKPLDEASPESEADNTPDF